MSTYLNPIEWAQIDWSKEEPYSLLYEDIYHSLDGGLEQSLHVFINGNNLIERWKKIPDNTTNPFYIGELGFGMGLNFLNTWQLWEQYAPPSVPLHYFSCEKHPLKKEDLERCLKKWPQLEKEATQLLKLYSPLTPGYHRISFGNGRIILNLMIGDALEQFEQLLICGESKLEEKLRSSFIDAWYLDGFTPKKNQNIWSEELMQIIALLSKKGTSIATYTAAASVKKSLSQIGFEVEKTAGFGPKRHMIRAVYTKALECKLKTRQTPWHTHSKFEPKSKRAIIIGAGLAGSFTAYFLAQKGWKVTVLEEQEHVGQGGSANTQAVLFPKLSAYQSPFTQLMLSAFIFAIKFYKEILKSEDLGKLSGALLLAYNEKEKKIQEDLNNWLLHYPELGLLVEQKQASELAGLALEHAGIFVPSSGWINSPSLCVKLLQNENITVVTKQKVDVLIYEEGDWKINDLKAPVLILANGEKANQFTQTQHLPLKAIRGQMTAIKSNTGSELLKIPLCGQGHVLPAYQGKHYFGASYDLGNNLVKIDLEDDVENKKKLHKLSPRTHWSETIEDHWAGIRASTPDYLPLVGPIIQETDFLNKFAKLKSNSKLWIDQVGEHHSGLYICSGFGSRGLTTIPLSTYWLASSIDGELSCLPRYLIQALSPSRFLYRNLIRSNNK